MFLSVVEMIRFFFRVCREKIKHEKLRFDLKPPFLALDGKRVVFNNPGANPMAGGKLARGH